mmetsp:Transcript_76877/g.235317  ORF Transcript_76877/g.235317 Transcript_76877/m.235317 type:complete len:216 (-) Transcript_76877:144-791(-)
MSAFSAGSSHLFAHRSSRRAGFGGGGSTVSASGSTTISSMRSMVTYCRRRRNRDCRPFARYLKVSISFAKVCCSTVALTLAYATVGLPIIVNILVPTNNTVPKTSFSPASRLCNFSHCTRSPTVTLCWCMTLDLNTAKASDMSNLGRADVSGNSGMGVRWGISRCHTKEHVGCGTGHVFGCGFQCLAMFILLELNFVVHCQRILRSLYVNNSFMF